MDVAARRLYAISPFAILKPLFYLNHIGEYSRRFDWFYLVLAVAITFLSHYRQRSSFRQGVRPVGDGFGGPGFRCFKAAGKISGMR